MFSLVLELCLDKIIEMRVLVLNFMTSRFKHDDLRLFVMEKYRIAAMLTIFTIMEPNPMLKVLSSSVVEKIKKAG